MKFNSKKKMFQSDQILNQFIQKEIQILIKKSIDHHYIVI